MLLPWLWKSYLRVRNVPVEIHLCKLGLTMVDFDPRLWQPGSMEGALKMSSGEQAAVLGS